MAFIENICIERFRGIRSLKMDGLRQVNLVVGDNNCGKTSVLEAIQLLRTSASLANVYRIARQRDILSVQGSNSIFDNLICLFPKNDTGKLEIDVSGVCNNQPILFQMSGTKSRVLMDSQDLSRRTGRVRRIPDGGTEADAFDGSIFLQYGGKESSKPVHIHQYSTVTASAEKDQFQIVYVAPFEHLRGNILNQVLRNEAYKQICIKALQLFDPEIEDMMIFRSDTGNYPVEYLRHKTLGDMPVSSYGDGLKKVLALSNAIAMSANGILLIDEVETAIHKKYYDDIFRFLVKACKSFHVQTFITTHSIEAIDGLLATQDYELQKETDDICVCTIKRNADASATRVLPGRAVYENREAFGFEVRL